MAPTFNSKWFNDFFVDIARFAMLQFRALVTLFLASLAGAAQFTNTPQDYIGITPGKPFTITWSGGVRSGHNITERWACLKSQN